MFRVRRSILLAFALTAVVVKTGGGYRTLAAQDAFLLPGQEPALDDYACRLPACGDDDSCRYSTCNGVRICNKIGRGGGCGCCEFDCDFLARGYYRNDQRIQWSGLETTFGAEGILRPSIVHKYDHWETKVLGEFYLNQPFDRNVLMDTQERRSYAANFDVETFEISQLFVSVRNGDLEATVGKMVTPFGRTYFPLYTNARVDAPFIRTESILWRETGMLIRYDPHLFVGEIAITNGCENRDTNSSKALISRLGIETSWLAAGFSVKLQDGIGSENQKEFKNHVGVDFMVRWGYFTLSGEAIYDEYGFRRPGFDPDFITWGRSIYYRDQNYRLFEPITGTGYYFNLAFDRMPWSVNLNYGEFYPKAIGDPKHDVVNRRGILKAAYYFTPYLQTYAVVMMENGGYIAQADQPRRGSFVLAGLQYTF